MIQPCGREHQTEYVLVTENDQLPGMLRTGKREELFSHFSQGMGVTQLSFLAIRM